jgi:hypothetical protein
LPTELHEFLKAWAAGSQVVEPLVDFTESDFAESNAFEDCRIRASNTLWVWKFAREPLLQQIQELLFLF